MLGFISDMNITYLTVEIGNHAALRTTIEVRSWPMTYALHLVFGRIRAGHREKNNEKREKNQRRDSNAEPLPRVRRNVHAQRQEVHQHEEENDHEAEHLQVVERKRESIDAPSIISRRSCGAKAYDGHP